MIYSEFEKLSAQDQLLICTAVLLDGREAPQFLRGDAAAGDSLAKLAERLAQLETELRVPLLGTLLRAASSRSAGGKG